MIKSIRTLSLPVPTRSENFNLFFQSLERAFLTKKINDEYKSEILINLLGERAHDVLLYIKEEELNDYEKLKSIVLREFQLTPRECLNSFKNAVKSSGETYIQFAARLTANFQYYCSLRKVNSFESLCDLIISDKLFETLNKETATHIGIREAEDWFRPIDLAKECDIYISSKNESRKEIPITYGYTQDPFKNRSQNFKPKIKENYPQYLERENKNCYICGDSSHYARDFFVCSVFFVCFRFSSGLDEKGKKEDVPLRTAFSQAGRLWHAAKAKHSLRAQAQQIKTKTCELLRKERRTTEVREQALPSAYHCQTYLLE
ncbi:uncharacterized protein TNCV_4393941 [Trichonephila clavipes]|uniref:Uncharacterized protein n=1 Tax=Trichonephila clavipes TaxID=2585209 RepID=A0A8X6W4S3_TRICX|nr:uncharacterized protein TNCV_4393941 [Trichonephila clavipes]